MFTSRGKRKNLDPVFSTVIVLALANKSKSNILKSSPYAGTNNMRIRSRVSHLLQENVLNLPALVKDKHGNYHIHEHVQWY